MAVDKTIPEDDGQAAHLPGTLLPEVTLTATDGKPVHLSDLKALTVIYIYPMTSSPNGPAVDGWAEIPGAKGCTPQSCSFRDHFAELKALGVAHLYGVSVQDTDYQREAAERLHLPFPLLSDENRQFQQALRLPVFEAGGMTLLKRLTLIASDGKIRHVFYPVFPPEKNADDVIDWLKSAHSKASG